MRILFTALLFCLFPVAVYAQVPSGIPPKTFARIIARSNAAVVAKWRREKGSSRKPKFAFRVTKVLRNFDPNLKTRSVKIGDRVTVKSATDAPTKAPGSQWLLRCVSTGQEESREFVWLPVQVSPASAAYISKAPLLDKPAVDRLKFFLAYLQHNEKVIADDAYREFLGTPYSAVATVGKKLSAQTVRAWISDPKTPPARVGLYAKMLGICGESDDADFLWQRIDWKGGNGQLDQSGLISGYLVLAGTDGLKKVDEQLQPDSPFHISYSVLSALRFLWTNHRERIGENRILHSMRRMIDWKKFADLVIPNLVHCRDWGVQDRLIKMYGEATPAAKRATIRYLMACSAQASKESSEKARNNLSELRRIDKKRVEAVMQNYSPRIEK